MVVKDKVFQQVEEVFLFADTSQHRGQFYAASIFLCQSFPLVEELPFRINGTHTCLQSVTEHDKGIVIEQLGDGIEIVAIVLVEGIHHLHIVVLQFHKQQGNTIHIAHDVCPTTIQGAMHLQLSHAKKLVLIW